MLARPHIAEQESRDLPLLDLYRLLGACANWISVDNFFHHMAWTRKKPGVVIWGPSDPLIFGHPENTNILVSRKNLREQQFWLWSQDVWRPEIFPDPKSVLAAVKTTLQKDGISFQSHLI